MLSGYAFLLGRFYGFYKIVFGPKGLIVLPISNSTELKIIIASIAELNYYDRPINLTTKPDIELKKANATSGELAKDILI